MGEEDDSLRFGSKVGARIGRGCCSCEKGLESGGTESEGRSVEECSTIGEHGLKLDGFSLKSEAGESLEPCSGFVSVDESAGDGSPRSDFVGNF